MANNGELPKVELTGPDALTTAVFQLAEANRALVAVLEGVTGKLMSMVAAAYGEGATRGLAPSLARPSGVPVQLDPTHILRQLTEAARTKQAQAEEAAKAPRDHVVGGGLA